MSYSIVIFWTLAIVTGTVIGRRKGRTFDGFILSAILSWLGVLITAFLPLSYEERVRRAVRDRMVDDEAERRLNP